MSATAPDFSKHGFRYARSQQLRAKNAVDAGGPLPRLAPSCWFLLYTWFCILGHRTLPAVRLPR